MPSNLNPEIRETLINIIAMFLNNDPYIKITACKLHEPDKDMLLTDSYGMQMHPLWNFDYVSYVFYGNPGKFTFTIDDFIYEFTNRREIMERGTVL